MVCKKHLASVVLLINNLITIFPSPTVYGVKEEIMSLFKTNTTKDYSRPTRVNNVYSGGKKSRKPIKQNTISLKKFKI